MHCHDFRLDAELRWGPKREPRSFHLDASAGLMTHQLDSGMYLPAEVSAFVERFRQVAPAWELSESTDVLELGREGVWVPDYRAVHKATGTDVFVEVVGFWKKASLDRLLRLLPTPRAAPIRAGDLRQAEGRRGGRGRAPRPDPPVQGNPQRPGAGGPARDVPRGRPRNRAGFSRGVQPTRRIEISLLWLDPPSRQPKRGNTMSRETTLKRILDGGIVAVVRSESSESLLRVVQALADGGVTAAEITFTVPDAVEVIRQVRKEIGDAIVLGAGTVLDPETARAALLAGAEYIVAPIVNVDVIRLCRRYDKAVMPGAFTPTEVVTAWEAGADIVKVFPADVGGPALSQGPPRPTSPDPPHADRGRRPDHRRGVPEGRRLLPGCRRFARRTEGGRRGRLRPHPRPCEPVRGDRSEIPGGTLSSRQGSDPRFRRRSRSEREIRD